MLKVYEVNTKEEFEQLRTKEVSSNDYLYILKYSGKIMMSDNGVLISFNNSNNADVIDASSQIVLGQYGKSKFSSYLHVQGKLVNFFINITVNENATSKTTDYHIATIPEQYAPSKEMIYQVMLNKGTSGYIILKTNGEMTLRGAIDGDGVRFSLLYLRL